MYSFPKALLIAVQDLECVRANNEKFLKKGKMLAKGFSSPLIEILLLLQKSWIGFHSSNLEILREVANCFKHRNIKLFRAC